MHPITQVARASYHVSHIALALVIAVPAQSGDDGYALHIHKIYDLIYFITFLPKNIYGDFLGLTLAYLFIVDIPNIFPN